MSETVKVSVVEEADGGAHVFVTEHLPGNEVPLGEPHPLGHYPASAAELQQAAQEKIDALFLDPQRVGSSLTEGDIDAIQAALRDCKLISPQDAVPGTKVHASPFLV